MRHRHHVTNLCANSTQTCTTFRKRPLPYLVSQRPFVHLLRTQVGRVRPYGSNPDRILTTTDCDLLVRTSSFWTSQRPGVKGSKSASGTRMQESIRNSNLFSPNSKTTKARRGMWNAGKLKSYISTSSSLANVFIVVTFSGWLLTSKTSPRFSKWQRSSILKVRSSLSQSVSYPPSNLCPQP